MDALRFRLPLVAVIAMQVACGSDADDDVVDPHPHPPPLAVIATSPSGGATQVATTTAIQVGFNRPIDPATIDATTFGVQQIDATGGGGDVAVAGERTVDQEIVRFEPSAPFAPGSRYRVTLGASIAALAANAPGDTLAIPVELEFETASPPPFVVLGTLPANGASGVSPASDLVIAFSAEVNAASLLSDIASAPTDGSTPNVFVNPGPTSNIADALAVTVAYDPTTRSVTLDPDVNLDFGAPYTITITSDVFATTGERIGLRYTATFTTEVGSIVRTAYPVDGEQNVPVTVEPTIWFTGFVDTSTIDARTITLTATSAFGDTIHVPIELELEDSTADGDPATFDRVRVVPRWDLVDCLPGDLPLRYSAAHELRLSSQLALASGARLTGGASLRFTTRGDPRVAGVRADNGFVAYADLDGRREVPVNSRLYVDFDVAMSEATVDASRLTLRPVGGAPVAATIEYDAATRTATLTPGALLAFDTEYELRVQGVDGSEAPFVRDGAGQPLLGATRARFRTSPANTFVFVPTPSAASRPMNHQLAVVFDRPLHPTAVAGIALRRQTTGASYTALAAYAPDTRSVTIAPVPLPSGLTLTLEVATTTIDHLGNPLPAARSGSFVFDSGASDTNPALDATNPLNGATGVAATAPYIATFSGENLLPSSVTPGSFSVTCGAAAITGHYDVVATGATTTQVRFVPDGYWPGGANCTVAFGTGLADLSRGELSSAATRTFRVENTAPVVTSLAPAAGTIAGDGVFTLTFSEPILPASAVVGTTVQLRDLGTGTLVNATAEVTGERLVLRPSAHLRAGRMYRLSVTSGITDLAGNGLATTGGSVALPADFTIETARPRLLSSQPAHGSTAVERTSSVALTFSEPMDASLLLGVTGGVAVSAATTCGAPAPIRTCARFDATRTVLTFSPSRHRYPSAAWPSQAVISVAAPTTAADAAGNLIDLAGSPVPTPATFTVADGPPDVLCSTPTVGEPGVSSTTSVRVGFSEAMNQAAVGAATRLIDGVSGEVIGTTATWSDARTLVLQPISALAADRQYHVTIAEGAADAGGARIPYPWNSWFTTAP